MIPDAAFKSVTRSVNVRYPIPFLSTVSLAFSLSSFGLAALIGGNLRWLVAGVGLTAFAFALYIIYYAIRRRPNLLRNEAFEIRMRELDIAGDNDRPQMVEDATAMEALSGPNVEGPSLPYGTEKEDANG